MTAAIKQLQHRIRVMERYMRVRLAMRDWHGVMDAAADLRELEAQLNLLKSMNQ